MATRKDNTLSIKAKWREYLTEITAPARTRVNGEISYICPICGHGNGGDGLTFVPDSDADTLKCFGCGFTGSDIDLEMVVSGTDFATARTAVADLVGVDLSGENTALTEKPGVKMGSDAFKKEIGTIVPKNTKTPYNANTGYLELCTRMIDESRRNLYDDEAIEYLKRRGISVETAERAGVGFLKDFIHPKTLVDNPEKAKRINGRNYIIFPNNGGGFTARTTDPATPANFKKMKAGQSGLFFLDAKIDTAKRLFVVEGEADALTVGEAGRQAVAICSTTGKDTFVAWAKDFWPADGAEIVVSLDNDRDGKTAGKYIIDALEGAKMPVFGFNLAGEYKDVNEAYTQDRAGVMQRLKRAETMEAPDKNAEERDAFISQSMAGRMADFNDAFLTSTPPTPTGFATLDEKLDGGLYEGLYIIGAVSSLGKTTFTLQLLDQIISNAWENDAETEEIDTNVRRDALIFSLEEPAHTLMAKVISRRTAEFATNCGRPLIGYAKTAREITDRSRYKNYRPEEIQLIETAKKDLEMVGEKLIVFDGKPFDALEIRQKVEAYKKVFGRVPIVMIDYLQIMSPIDPKEDTRNSINRTLTELANLSHEYKTPVIVISSFNRQSYNQEVNFSSSKESGNIEYSADVLIGLQFAGVGSSSFDEFEARNRGTRKIELCILKNRGAQTGIKIGFDYIPAYNRFADTGEIRTVRNSDGRRKSR